MRHVHSDVRKAVPGAVNDPPGFIRCSTTSQSYRDEKGPFFDVNHDLTRRPDNRHANAASNRMMLHGSGTTNAT